LEDYTGQHTSDPPRSRTAQVRTGDLSRWAYRPAWRHRPHDVADSAARLRAAGPWLVLATDPLGAALVTYLRAAGTDAVLARPGAATFGGVTPRTVVDLSCLGGAAGAAGNPAGAAPLDAAFALVRALSGHAPVDLVAVTEEALGVGGAAPARPLHAALGGLVPVLAQENPGWRCRHVDIARRAVPGPDALVAAIAAEALAGHAGPVALRGAGRWARVYEPYPLPPPTPTLGRRRGAAVLITGGLGHLGLMLARHLALGRDCRVALTGRTALPDHRSGAVPAVAARVRAVREIAAVGGDVVALTADVTDAARMRAAVAAVEERWGPLDLVVHAAGCNDDAGYGPAHLIDRAAVDAHLATKAVGMRVLGEVFAGRDVRGIAMSSLSAVLGGHTYGAYAAANAALDACALRERARGNGRWLTVDWDTWRPDHLAHNPGHTGAFDMAPEESLEVFDRIVEATDHVEHLVISTGSLDARIQQWVVRNGQTSVTLGHPTTVATVGDPYRERPARGQ